MSGFEALAGRLRLCPGAAHPVCIERPMVGATMMRRLAEGRRAALLPDLVAAVFTLTAAAHRSTARRAVQAAFGHAADAAAIARDREALRMGSLREHLQRFALDLPARVPVAGAGPDPAWLRELPAAPDAEALSRRMLGLPAAAWLQRWADEGGDWLARWAAAGAHPVARWLAGVHAPAREARWPLVALPDAHPEALPALAREMATALAADPHFAEQPRWRGLSAETGPWTRGPVPAASAWDRLGARLAELLMLAGGQAPEAGALALAPGEGIAWTAMSRGLLMHWVRLDGLAPEQARIAGFRVLAPTEWNFHPAGGFGQALCRGDIAPEAAALAAAALDPCLEVEVATHA